MALARSQSETLYAPEGLGLYVPRVACRGVSGGMYGRRVPVFVPAFADGCDVWGLSAWSTLALVL